MQLAELGKAYRLITIETYLYESHLCYGATLRGVDLNYSDLEAYLSKQATCTPRVLDHITFKSLANNSMRKGTPSQFLIDLRY